MSELLSISADYAEYIYHRAGVPENCHFSLGDSQYHIFTPDDITKRLGPEVKSVLTQLGFTFKENKRDCDKFTRFAVAWADFLNSENPTEFAPLISETWARAIAHAFVSAIHRRDGQFYAAWYEPQIVDGYSLMPIELTAEQIASIYEIRR